MKGKTILTYLKDFIMKNEEYIVLDRIYRKGNIVNIAESKDFCYKKIVTITKRLKDLGFLDFNDKGILFVTDLGKEELFKNIKCFKSAVYREEKQIPTISKEEPVIPRG